MGTLITTAVLALLLWLTFWVFFPLGRGAIYDPSSPAKVRLIAEMAGVRPGERAADLGSGDGRVVIALAMLGAEAHGFEVNPFLVLRSRRNIRRAGLSGRAFIHWGSFWSADLAGFSLVTVFQVSFVMGRLEAKLRRELPRGARVVSHHWLFPGAQPVESREDIHVYRFG